MERGKSTPREDVFAREPRPRTRADCVDGPRPCPYSACRHHLLLEIKAQGSIVLRHGHDDPSLLEESCALDVAERGGHTCDEIGSLMGYTRQNADAITHAALGRLRSKLRISGVSWDGVVFPEGNPDVQGGDSGRDVEEGEVYESPGTARPATRRPFLPDSHLALVRAFARRADPSDPSPPADEEVERLRELARLDGLEDDEGWCSRVWDAYARYDRRGRRRTDEPPSLELLNFWNENKDGGD